MTQYAPGMRVLIRDEEWLVKSVDTNSRGGYTLNVAGISPLVKDRESRFISELENIIRINPEETNLVADTSPFFNKSLLYIESLLRRKVPTDKKLYIGYRAAMNQVPYQLDPAIMALSKLRQRILIADSVGLGKTLEAGVLLSELIIRGKGKRILVVTTKSMMTQFQKEMWSRFTIPLMRLDSKGISRIRSYIPANHNPFYYFDKVIISVDTLKRDLEYRTYLENAWWDIIVIDEAHNVAERGSSLAQRARLANLLSERSDTLIMLTATPHDGRPESFASLMNMLDPTAIANPSDYTKEDIKGLCIRRFKKDIQDQAESSFRIRRISEINCDATDVEEEAFDYLSNLKFKSLERGRSAGELFKTILTKSLFSSPAACLDTIKNRLYRMKDKTGKDAEVDREKLETLKEKISAIEPKKFSRYINLVNLLSDKDYGWDPRKANDRVVIFTERIETLKFLHENLKKDLKLKDKAIEIMHGGMSDIEQQRIVEEFGRESSPVRVLVASDVASEGINLHYLSHRLIHFDIPWSLMVFQQRNGRIDRFGQTETPDIRYMVTKSQNSDIKGDLRILEILIAKEEQAVKNIGDPSVLMDVYDIEEEERITAKAIEEKISPEEFDKKLSIESAEQDLVSIMLASQQNELTKDYDTIKDDIPGLFSDIDYLEKALIYFSQYERIPYEITPNRKRLKIDLTKELRSRLKEIITEEAITDENTLRLTVSPEEMEKEIIKSRQVQEEQQSWPAVHYLWGLHPIYKWLNDKAGTLFARRVAPVLGVSGVLDKGESLYILSGLIPNRKSQPVLNEWFGMLVSDDQVVKVLSLEEIIKIMPLQGQPNMDKLRESHCKKLEEKLPMVIQKAESFMKEKWNYFENTINPQLDKELKALEKLKSRHYEQLSLFDIETDHPGTKALNLRKKEDAQRKIDRLFDSFMTWVEDTMTLEKESFIQVIAVITEV